MAEIVDFGLQQHKIKMDSRYFENILSVVAGDTGRRIEVQLLDTNGMVQDTTGLNLRLNALVAGKATFTDATLVDATTGKYQLDLSNGMFLAPGNWQFQWQITDSAGKKLHSFAFTGNVGKNISEGGSQATNFYLNLEDLKKMQDDLINGTIDSSILETTITEKLADLETQYAPKLNEVTAQLDKTVLKADSAEKVANASIKQSSSVQKQLDTLVLESGESDLEVAQARHDETGAYFPTIKDRIDNEQLKIDQVVVPEYEAVPSTVSGPPNMSYTTQASTFSGWGTPVGVHSNFNALKLNLKPFDTTFPVTKIRVIVKLNNHLGEVIGDTVVTQTLPHLTVTTITATFDQVIKNESGAPLFVEFHTNGRVAVNTIIKKHTYATAVYSTRSSITDLSLVNVELLSNMFVEFIYPDRLVKYGVVETFANSLKEELNIPAEFVDDVKFKSSFYEHVDRNVNSASPIEPIRLYTTSTFSGWGTALYPTPKKVSNIRFKFRNRAVAVTSVKVYITMKNKNGTILSQQTIPVVGGKPNEDVIVDWTLDTPINNTSENYLYFTYSANQIIDMYGYSGPLNTGLDFGFPSYSTNGSQYGPDSNIEVGVVGGSSVLYLWYEEFDKVELYIPRKEVLEIANLDPGDTVVEYSIRVVLPDKIYAVVGDTLQLFYRGIVEAVDPYQFDIRVICSKGKHFPRYFEFTPTLEEVGQYNFQISVRDDAGKVLGKSETTIVVNKPVAPTKQTSVLTAGDSLTSAGIWVKEAHRRLTASDGLPKGSGLSNFNFIGTKKNGIVGFEGYGGWTWDYYLAKPDSTTLDINVTVASHDKTAVDQKSVWKDTNNNLWELETIEPTRLKFVRKDDHKEIPVMGGGSLVHVSNATHTTTIAYTDLQFADGNPFWDANLDRVSFKTYCERNGFSGIDLFYPLLTWNGGRTDKATIQDNLSVITSAKKLIDILHLEYPNAKVRIMGVQLPSLNGGTGTSYGANGGYANTYGLVRGVFGLNLAYQNWANEAAYSSFLDFINVSSQFDSENMMPEVTKPVNTRSTKTELFGTNGVHPTTDGYLMIGDVGYRSMINDSQV